MGVIDERNMGHGAAAPADAISLGQRFAQSQRFRDLFAGGMALVEETADYLDTEGREASRVMDAPLAGLYSSESMRLTTRLMQLASWLLLQRAVAEGDMTPEQALEEKRNVRLDQAEPARAGLWPQLPDAFVDLIERSLQLQRRLQHLDDEIYGESGGEETGDNPVAAQHRLLETAFFNAG